MSHNCLPIQIKIIPNCNNSNCLPNLSFSIYYKMVLKQKQTNNKKKKRLFQCLNSFLFLNRNPWACVIHEQASCSPLEWILKKLRRYSFRASKIPWLFQFHVKFFQISRNSLNFPWHFSSATKFPDFSRFPEIPGPLATLI